MATADIGGQQRVAAIRTMLRLSRDGGLMPRLEAAVASLDNGRRLWAAPAGEHALLARVAEHLDETLDPEGPAVWRDGRRSGGARRADLLLTVLRLTRDRAVLSALATRLADLDDGRRPRADPGGERALLREVGARWDETVEPVGLAALRARALARGEQDAIARARLGLAPPEGTPPRDAAAIRAAGELLGRQEAGEAVEAGAATSDGWTLVERLGLAALAPWHSTDLLALRPPDGGGTVHVAVGGDAPEVRDEGRVRAELAVRRLAADAAEEFSRATGGGTGPARRAE